MPTTHDVSSLVAEAAADRPDMLAVVEAGGRSVTWSGLEDEVARIATGLGAAGLVAGQRVLLALGNRIEFVASYLGVLRAQVVAVPVNPRATAGELARMAADSGCRVVVADDETIGTVREALELLRAPVRSCLGSSSWARRRRATNSPTRRCGRPPRGPYRRCLTRRSWHACSTRVVRRAARARRCSRTVPCSPTSTRQPRSNRR